MQKIIKNPSFFTCFFVVFISFITLFANTTFLQKTLKPLKTLAFYLLPFSLLELLEYKKGVFHTGRLRFMLRSLPPKHAVLPQVHANAFQSVASFCMQS